MKQQTDIRLSPSDKIFVYKDTKFIVVDVSEHLRFAVPIGKINELGISTKGKQDTEIVAELTACLNNRAKNDKTSFVGFMKSYAEEIISLKEKGLNIKDPICFSFFVLPDEQIWNDDQLRSGKRLRDMRAAGKISDAYPLDTVYPNALQVNWSWFKDGYTSSEQQNIRTQVCALHELSHGFHGAYFWTNLGNIGEGFAEMLPYYLMDMELKDTEHAQEITHLKTDDLKLLADLNERGIFADGYPTENQTVQNLKSYQSMYLWMVGYMKRIEDYYHMDKFQATNFVLKKFSQIAQFPDSDKRMEWIAHIADIDNPKDMLFGTILQQEGLNHIRNTFQINTPHSKITTVTVQDKER